MQTLNHEASQAQYNSDKANSSGSPRAISYILDRQQAANDPPNGVSHDPPSMLCQPCDSSAPSDPSIRQSSSLSMPLVPQKQCLLQDLGQPFIPRRQLKRKELGSGCDVNYDLSSPNKAHQASNRNKRQMAPPPLPPFRDTNSATGSSNETRHFDGQSSGSHLPSRTVLNLPDIRTQPHMATPTYQKDAWSQQPSPHSIQRPFLSPICGLADVEVGVQAVSAPNRDRILFDRQKPDLNSQGVDRSCRPPSVLGNTLCSQRSATSLHSPSGHRWSTDNGKYDTGMVPDEGDASRRLFHDSLNIGPGHTENHADSRPRNKFLRPFPLARTASGSRQQFDDGREIFAPSPQALQPLQIHRRSIAREPLYKISRSSSAPRRKKGSSAGLLAAIPSIQWIDSALNASGRRYYDVRHRAMRSVTKPQESIISPFFKSSTLGQNGLPGSSSARLNDFLYQQPPRTIGQRVALTASSDGRVNQQSTRPSSRVPPSKDAPRMTAHLHRRSLESPIPGRHGLPMHGKISEATGLFQQPGLPASAMANGQTTRHQGRPQPTHVPRLTSHGHGQARRTPDPSRNSAINNIGPVRRDVAEDANRPTMQRENGVGRNVSSNGQTEGSLPPQQRGRGLELGDFLRRGQSAGSSGLRSASGLRSVRR